mmetsp:Transcript_17909/g.49125  ORF Transcript_17909/g.49125 Transcript_17909/m.49125 type:complete len:792 (-) Transcript_17909:123-2498(-)
MATTEPLYAAAAATPRVVGRDIGLDTSTADSENAFVAKLLDALEANHRACCGSSASNAVANDATPSTGADLAATLQALEEEVRGADEATLSAIAIGLQFVVFQLRTWYTAEAGLLLLDIFDRISLQRGTWEVRFATLRVLEGLVLQRTACHAPKRTARVLEALLRRRRMPPGASARLEAALVCLEGPSPERLRPGVPKKPHLAEASGDDWLYELVASLEPDAAMVARVDEAKAALNQVVSAVFPGCSPAYFGSTVNGFGMKSSDVDCVVWLSADHIAKLLGHDAGTQGSSELSSMQRKNVAIAAACALGEKMRHDPDVHDMGLCVKEVVLEARVPLLKCESVAGIDIDVSFNNRLPLFNSELLRAYADLDPRVRDLGRLVKWWAKRRHVNDALDGTLSSYVHILLVIHYLQRIGLVPNLQDKNSVVAEIRESCGQPDLVDGIHDVWFVDPVHARPDPPPRVTANATLRGLLAGFFFYFAYMVPVYSDVVSIRDPRSIIRKDEYFRAIAATRAANKAKVSEEHAMEKTECDQALIEAFEGVDADAASSESEDVVMLGGHFEEDVDDFASDTQAPQLPDSHGQTAREGVSRPPIASRWKILPEQAVMQHEISRRQTLCVEDPMELGRTLGTTYQGMERLAYEQRRACLLLAEGCGREELEELFEPKPNYKPHDSPLPSVVDDRAQGRRSGFRLAQGEQTLAGLVTHEVSRGRGQPRQVGHASAAASGGSRGVGQAASPVAQTMPPMSAGEAAHEGGLRPEAAASSGTIGGKKKLGGNKIDKTLFGGVQIQLQD